MDWDTSVGRFHSGVPHGWCVKTLADGDVYTGCLVRGRRQGFGQYQWFGGGDVYTGMQSRAEQSRRFHAFCVCVRVFPCEECKVYAASLCVNISESFTLS